MIKMINILEKIKTYKLEEIEKAKTKKPVTYLNEQILKLPPPLKFEAALREKEKTSYGIIAEIKKASPSRGIIRKDFKVNEIARAYKAGGAACLSVLTDFASFMGHQDYVKEAKKSSLLPILRKDFLYDPYQVLESRAIGADCILIIMATVSDQQAKELEDSAIGWGLDVLVEVHNLKDLERALKLQSKFIGINNRNLKTFKVNLETSLELIKKIPGEYHVVSESGLRNKSDLAKLAKVDIRSFLIGESLMKEKNIEEATKRLIN